LTFKFDRCPIIVPVRLFGATKAVEVRLVLDTGASISVLRKTLLERIGVPLGDSSRSIVLTTAQGYVRVPLVEIPAVEFLGCLKDKPTVAVHDLPKEANVDGLLGTDLLRGLSLKIDFLMNELEISVLER
jgi:predicted aspartyl protease